MDRRRALSLIARALGAAPFVGLAPGRLGEVAAAAHRRSAAQVGPSLLDERQSETVALIAEHIIPVTDTPGARAAGVERFVDAILDEWYEDDERERFLRGLRDLDRESRERFGKPFAAVDREQQVTLLAEADAELAAILEAGGEPGDHFFGQMKWLTLYGYYTSEIGQKEELQAEILPGYYDGCAPVRRNTPGGW